MRQPTLLHQAVRALHTRIGDALARIRRRMCTAHRARIRRRHRAGAKPAWAHCQVEQTRRAAQHIAAVRELMRGEKGGAGAAEGPIAEGVQTTAAARRRTRAQICTERF